MKLYFASDTCSFAPHMILQELALPYELVRVNNRTKRTSDGGNFLAINPKGYVAALQIESGEVFTEGSALLQYLADLKPEARLAPRNGSLERVRLQQWLNFITAEIHAGSTPLFNKEFPATVQAFFTSRLIKRFALVEETLEHQDYLMGKRFTVADAYLFTVLGWMPGFGIDLDRWPNIAGFITRIADRPSLMAALKREQEVAPVA